MSFVSVIASGLLLALCSGAKSGDPNLVGHWRFDEGADSTAVDSVGASNGNVIGGNWINDTQRGWILDLEGSVYADIGLSGADPPATVNEQMTIAFWQDGNNNMSGEQGAAFWTDFVAGRVHHFECRSPMIGNEDKNKIAHALPQARAFCKMILEEHKRLVQKSAMQ